MAGVEDLSLWHLQVWHGEIKEFSRVDFWYNLSYLIMLFPSLSDLKQNKHNLFITRNKRK